MMEEKKFQIIYDADEGGIKKTFFKKNGFRHNSGVRFCVLPFDTKEQNMVKDFSNVIGCFIRLIIERGMNEEINVDKMIANMINQVNMDVSDKEAFRDIINQLYVVDGKLALFNIKSMAYISSQKSSEEKVALFLNDVLMNDELKEKCKETILLPEKNIMNKLVFESLPKLEQKKYKQDKYTCLVPYVKEYFQKDLAYLVTQPALFSRALKRVLEYYYMFYVTQLAMKFCQFHRADRNQVEPLFYTLSWEVTSQDRDAYVKGYSHLKNCVKELFSHIVTLELLNHNNMDKVMDYIDLFEYCEKNDSEELRAQIEELISNYKGYVSDVTWSECNERNIQSSGNASFDSIRKLFNCVAFQFRKSQRHTPHDKYSNWILAFIQERFGRSRGRNGMNFNITEEDIILFTQVIVGVEGGKILREKLFKEMEHRGLFFDRDSKNKIIELYEKLNLIEKKSDSGDAQYVRANI